MKRITWRRLLPLLFSLILGFSCEGSGSAMKDGYFTAEAAEFDDFGWKEYVTVCVYGNRIILVEYNAFNQSGFIKSWDMNYMRVMNAVDGTYPNAYTRNYGKQLLANQGTRGVDMISGATHSYQTFIRLADAAIDNARKGNVETRQVRFDGQNNAH